MLSVLLLSLGKAVNLGDGDGIQVLCMLKITGKRTLIDILTKELCDYLKWKIFNRKSMNFLLCNSLLGTKTCLK